MHISIIAVLLFFESLISGPTYKHGAVGFPKTLDKPVPLDCISIRVVSMIENIICRI